MNVEKKRKQVELLRLQASFAELEMKVMEREAEIRMIQKNMESQKLRMGELQNEINSAQE